MKNQTINLDQFFNTTRKNVEKKIADTITDEKIISILNGGKRLRSFLAHLSFKACTKGEETQSQFQKALEEELVKELLRIAKTLSAKDFKKWVEVFKAIDVAIDKIYGSEKTLQLPC